ncbi:tetratricopeptide repeat protein, partial [uncultured Clostridium sp.]
MSCWAVLRITPTRNIDKIKKAYIELSNSLSENNKYAEELKLAYNKAISLATASIGDLNIGLLNNPSFDILSALINSSINDSEIDSIDKFINETNDIYNNPTARFSKDSWVNLLALPILNNPSINQKLEVEFINYIYTHKYLPSTIYNLINSRFNWTNRKDELKAIISSEIIEFIINEINNPLPLSYNYLSEIKEEHLDEYLSLREKAYLSLTSTNKETDKSYLFDAYSIYTKDLDLLKLLGTYYLNKNDNLMALNYFREAINIEPNDMFCLSYFGHLLAKNNQYSTAIYYLEKYLKKLKNTLDLERIIDLAHCYHHSYDLQKAKDLYTLIIKLRPWDISIKAELNIINNKLSNNSLSLPLTIPIYKKYLNPYIEPFMDKLKEIYDNFSLRIEDKSWEELFTLPIASNEILFYLLEQNVIEFVTNNKNIPKNIFIFLNNKFDWISRYEELISIYPNLKIDYLIDKLSFNETLSYNSLKNISISVLEEYIDLRSIAYDLVYSGSNDSIYYLNKALNLYKEDFELYKLFGQYYSNNNNY